MASGGSAISLQDERKRDKAPKQLNSCFNLCNALSQADRSRLVAGAFDSAAGAGQVHGQRGQGHGGREEMRIKRLMRPH